MTCSAVKQLIDKQADIHKRALENYEMEACEIIVYDAILDYCVYNQFSIGNFKPSDLVNKQDRSTEEDWMIITRLYADMLSEENKLSVDPSVIELLNYYHDKFWESDSNFQG
jgi:hypothetical protein